MNYPIDSLIQKFLNGESTEEDNLQLERYLIENQIDDLYLTENEKTKIDLRLRKKLGIWKRNTLKTMYSYISIAATVGLIVGGYFFYHQNINSKLILSKLTKKIENRDGIEVKNTSKIARIISLEDGSTVQLEPGSSFTYPEHFLKISREVHLYGEALFNVTSNPEKPFIVYTENIVTQVIGTSFRIKSSEKNDNIEVSVLKGKVSVYESENFIENHKNGIILTPNQKVTFKKNSQKMDIGIIPEPAIIDPEHIENFDFIEQPISSVIKTLQSAYGIEIILENATINKCVFTGDLNGLPMDLQLELLCKSIQAKFERRGTTIFITGNGCQQLSI